MEGRRKEVEKEKIKKTGMKEEGKEERNT